MPHNILLLTAPEILKNRLRADTRTYDFVRRTRRAVKSIMTNPTDDRLLVVAGPCSIHNTSAAISYCKMLVDKREQFSDTLEIIVRLYAEKPRTTIGWKGLVNDPYLDGSNDINAGLEITRRLMLQATKRWGSIGARTSESQVHRELVSGCEFPFGFKNSTNGSLAAAINSITASSVPHSFMSVGQAGSLARITTEGNVGCHLVLRGGTRPNYDVNSVRRATEAMAHNQLQRKLVVDVSHSNSQKDFRRQIPICEGIAERLGKGECGVGGVMVESNLAEGRQAITLHPQPDKSITDGCIGWNETAELLTKLSEAVWTRRANSTTKP